MMVATGALSSACCSSLNREDPKYTDRSLTHAPESRTLVAPIILSAELRSRDWDPCRSPSAGVWYRYQKPRRM